MTQEVNAKFIKAYDELADSIFRYCYFRILNYDLAQDLVQETFTRVWEYLAAGKEITNIRAFAYKVAKNLIIDESRKRKTMSLELLQEKGVQPKYDGKEKLYTLLHTKDIISVLEKLDGRYREVIMLRYVEEFSVKEIAEILEETENTISVRIHRGLQKVRTIIK